MESLLGGPERVAELDRFFESLIDVDKRELVVSSKGCYELCSNLLNHLPLGSPADKKLSRHFSEIHGLEWLRLDVIPHLHGPTRSV